MFRSPLTMLLAAGALLLSVIAIASGLLIVWAPAAGAGLATVGLAIRDRRKKPGEFPAIEIQPESELHVALLRLTNLDDADTFRARILRVTHEDTLSDSPPWPVSWQGVSGPEMLLHRDESHRLEIGRVVPGPEGELPELHFARPLSAGSVSRVVMPWPAGIEDGDHGADFGARRIRAEIEITSEHTGEARLVQVRLGVDPPDWQVDVQLMSIDFADVRRPAERDAA